MSPGARDGCKDLSLGARVDKTGYGIRATPVGVCLTSLVLMTAVDDGRDGRWVVTFVSSSASVPSPPDGGPAGPARDDQPAFEDIGGYEIQQYVVAELNEERQRRVRIDAQGASLITGSTALFTLALAATSLVGITKTFELPRLSLWLLAFTFAAFMFAAFCGLRGGGRIHKNETVPLPLLESWRMSDRAWLGTRETACRIHLHHLIKYLEQIRRFNRRRAKWVVCGSWFQIAALFGLSLAVAAILLVVMFPGHSGPHDLLEPPSKKAAT